MRLLLICIITFASLHLSAKNIATINIFEIINNNTQYVDFLKKLNDKQLIYDDFLSLKKIELENAKIELENVKDIYSNDVLNNKINKFNNDLMTYQKKIENIDDYINQNISYNEKIIMQSIAKITSEYAREKDIHLILNENNFFIASNDIDISEYISKKLKNITFEFKLLNESDFFEN